MLVCYFNGTGRIGFGYSSRVLHKSITEMSGVCALKESQLYKSITEISGVFALKDDDALRLNYHGVVLVNSLRFIDHKDCPIIDDWEYFDDAELAGFKSSKEKLLLIDEGDFVEDSMLEIKKEQTQEYEEDGDAESLLLVSEIKRENDFNRCLAQVIKEFFSANGYHPNVNEVIHRINHNPPHGYDVKVTRKNLSIDGSSPRKIENVKRTIYKLLRGS